MIQNSENFENPNIHKELNWCSFKDWFVRAFWEFKKVNRIAPQPKKSILNDFEETKHLARYEFEQFNNCMYMIIQASYMYADFKNTSNTLCYASIFKLFEDMHQEDPTNEKFYRHIFHHKNLMKKP